MTEYVSADRSGNLTVPAGSITESLTIPADKINIGETTLAPLTINMDSNIKHEFHATTNCRNCGAPLNKNRDCDYCGTKHQLKSSIRMDGCSISMEVG